jgi:membrane protein YdbS with pleckstrin-like domain
MREAILGAGLVLLGHAVVLTAVGLYEGAHAPLSYSTLALVLLGLIQLVYVLPLLAYGLWRRRPLAAGAGAMAVLTVAFSLTGFYAT